mgnify:CR=1 FL=1
MKLVINSIIIILTISFNPLWAQDKPDSYSMSLQECIDFAIENAAEIQNAQLDVLQAEKQVKETIGIGLPQVDGEVNWMNNFAIQTVFLPAAFFPDGAPGDPAVPVRFGVQHTASAGINLNQLIFDGSYIVGLQAANTYQDLSRKALVQSKIATAEAVTKAFYSVLINKERLTLIIKNVNRLDTLLRETQIMYDNGFAEKIDLDRIKVNFNNLSAESKNTQRLLALSYSLLKFQMGMDINTELILNGSLEDISLAEIEVDAADNFDYKNRIEFSQLLTQREINILDLKNRRVANWPKLNGFVGLGYNAGKDSFSDIVTFDGNTWFEYGNFGLSLKVPVFSGFQRHNRIQQAKIEVAKTENNLNNLRKNIDLQIDQAQTNLNNALESLEAQQENMELANEIYEVTKIKYQEGVGSNFEVIEADTDAKEAETNYYNALYDAIIAKIELKKALGILDVN